MTDNEKTLQGFSPNLTKKADLFAALDKAFDYRGDVTITLRNDTQIVGYVFDRHAGQGMDDSFVKLMPIDSEDHVEIAYADIADLKFTGKDAAHGRSWESWIKKYVEKKRKGEQARLDPEPLD